MVVAQQLRGQARGRDDACRSHVSRRARAGYSSSLVATHHAHPTSYCRPYGIMTALCTACGLSDGGPAMTSKHTTTALRSPSATTRVRALEALAHTALSHLAQPDLLGELLGRMQAVLDAEPAVILVPGGRR